MMNTKRSLISKKKAQSYALYLTTIIVIMWGLSYASVPLYRLFCQVTGLGGTAQISTSIPTIQTNTETNEGIGEDKNFIVHFNADVSDSLPWKFRPAQNEIIVHPGETILAFYKAYNPTDKSIVGISTYNVTPTQAGQYFHKIQCFCFEEQRLKAKESIEMPVFFFLDPDIVKDSKMQEINVITLSYTFFEVPEKNLESN